MPVEFYRQANGDYLAVEPEAQEAYHELNKDEMQTRAPAVAGDPSSVRTCSVGLAHLAGNCRRVARQDVPEVWRRHIGLDTDDGEPLEETPLWLDGKVRAAAADALGYWPFTETILGAVAEHEGTDDVRLSLDLADAEGAFEEAGGRGPGLADAIDSLRIAQAVRQALAGRQQDQGP